MFDKLKKNTGEKFHDVLKYQTKKTIKSQEKHIKHETNSKDVFSRIFSQNVTEVIKPENIRLHVQDEFVIIMSQNPLKVDSSNLMVTFRWQKTSTPPQVQLGPNLV